jgi:hypothetical protein
MRQLMYSAVGIPLLPAGEDVNRSESVSSRRPPVTGSGFRWMSSAPDVSRPLERPWHGFLTLSLLPYLTQQAIRIEGLRLTLNYGLNRVRFPPPLPAGSRVRVHFTLLAADPIADGIEARWHASFEREGAQKPVCVAELVARYYS